MQPIAYGRKDCFRRGGARAVVRSGSSWLSAALSLPLFLCLSLSQDVFVSLSECLCLSLSVSVTLSGCLCPSLSVSVSVNLSVSPF